MARQQVGAVLPVLGLVAAPDTNNGRRFGSWARRYQQDLNGASGAVVGTDRGDHVHSFNGPVELLPGVVTNAVGRGTVSLPGVYRPVSEFNDSVSDNPALDPWRRALWARMGQ